MMKNPFKIYKIEKYEKDLDKENKKIAKRSAFLGIFAGLTFVYGANIAKQDSYQLMLAVALTSANMAIGV